MQITEIFIDHHNLNEITDLIIRDCKYYLQLINNRTDTFHLYRAISSPIDKKLEFFIKKQRKTNRQPVDTPIHIHNLINKLGKEIFGWNIRNGVFVTGDFSFAEEFVLDRLVHSYVYEIFPIGKFDFVYNTEEKDFYEYINDLINDIIDREIPHNKNVINEQDIIKILTKKENYQQLYEFIESTFTDQDLITGIKLGHEISLNVNSYYGIMIDEDTMEKYKTLHEILKNKLISSSK